MATYIGFSTIDRKRKFTLTDNDLVVRDVLNSLLIKKGEKLGRPDYGTDLWGLVFEPLNDQMIKALQQELQQTIEQDPRVKFEDAQVNPGANGILVELFITVLPTSEQQRLSLFFDQDQQTLTLL
jgi:phage baseplate assembly protein W